MGSACSLHSLDYLGAGSPADSGGAGAGGGGGSSPGGSAGAGGTNGGELGRAGSSSSGASGATTEPPDCEDGRATVDETDIDCGGRTCAPCADEQRCVTGTDCVSAICTNQVCQAPSCVDLALNGDETDLNCGGSCAPCPQGRRCTIAQDCSTATCVAGICESASCQDGVLSDDCPLLVDNTPYSLAPSHALDKCLDDSKLSMLEGNPMQLFSCRAQLQQTFWAVAQPDGYFALRSALSGKCLQVRGASMESGVVIEQSACDLAPEQLWKPVRIDKTFMKLVCKLSGLPLDVAGLDVDADRQPIVQGTGLDSADTHWRVTRRATAAYMALSPASEHGLRVLHDTNTITLSDADGAESQWKVVPGLADAGLVSFQSRNDPGRYLRHAGFRLWSDNSDGSALFQKDATFRFVSPLAGTVPFTAGLEASNYPGYYVVRTDNLLRIRQSDDSDAFNDAATWFLAGR